jgi:hypothetical protein
MMFITSDFPASGRRLSTMARSASSSRLARDAGAHHAADVRRDDDDLVLAVALLDVVDHHRAAEEVVGRDVEETLDLAGVQVDGQDAVGAGRGDQVGDQLGRDRRAAVGLPVLAGIAEIGDHRRDAPGRGALQRIHHDQQLHQVVIGRVRGRLDDEDVLAADILIDSDEDFLVCEGFHLRAGQSHVQIVGNGFGQRTVCVAGEKFHVGFDPVAAPDGDAFVTGSGESQPDSGTECKFLRLEHND